jgi:DNA-directed RNA polymerase specialized sigma subunit
LQLATYFFLHKGSFSENTATWQARTTGDPFIIDPHWLKISATILPVDELPITRRLANVVQSMGARTLGDLNGRTACELLQCKNCYWRTVAEIQQLIERSIAGEFDVERIEESKAEAELLTLLEQGMAKLSRREKQFLLARIRGLTFAEIGRRFGLTRARVHQVVVKALDTLRKTWGPRVPRLLEMEKRQEKRRSV